MELVVAPVSKALRMNFADLFFSLLPSTRELLFAVFLLGVKHGFDADHLAAIDSLARINARSYPVLSKQVGMLFSLGHGTIVIIAALCIATWITSLEVPPWMERTGNWLSIGLLIVLAGANLLSVFRSSPGVAIRSSGWHGVLFTRLFSAGHASTAFCIGALFALSYDTLSVAALFGLIASRSHGAPTALLLGATFVVGMLVTDGLNGMVVAKMMKKSEKNAYFASLVMALAVAGAGLCTASFGIAKQFLPSDSQWIVFGETWLGVALCGFVIASFIVGFAVGIFKIGQTVERQENPPAEQDAISSVGQLEGARIDF